MKLKNKDTILFIGDSITDCQRKQPLGQNNGLGIGYVSLMDALLRARHPDLTIRVLNTGLGGNKVTDLDARWESDALAHSPDWISVMIGINDVWRQFDTPWAPDQVDIELFETTYQRLIARTVEGQSPKKMMLVSPYYLETNLEDPMRKKMDTYRSVTRRLAQRNALIYVDVQDAFDEYLKFQPTQTLCGDRIHPNLTGHLLIAQTILQAIER